jgi:hypothetical protein
MYERLLWNHRPDEGGSKHLWNVGQLLPDYTAQYPRRLLPSYSPPLEPEISIVTLACRGDPWVTGAEPHRNLQSTPSNSANSTAESQVCEISFDSERLESGKNGRIILKSVFWIRIFFVVTPCKSCRWLQTFRGMYRLHLQNTCFTLKMELTTHKTTWCHNPAVHTVHSRCLKSRMFLNSL